MEKQLAAKKNHVITPSKIDTDNISPDKIDSTEADDDCQDRIKKLEARIANMQAWQDYLEETMQKEKSGETAVNDRFRKEINPALSPHFESFFEENNLSANKKLVFIELLIERELELRDAHSNIANREDLQKERENIETNYNNLISNLLSEEEYTAYQEYVETEQDRGFIRVFKMSALSGDNQLNKQQEKDLVTALSRKRLDIENAMGIRELRSKGNPHRKEDMRKIIESEKKISNEYLEAAKDILTDSQMKKFKEFIDLQNFTVEMMENQLSQMPEDIDSDAEKADE